MEDRKHESEHMKGISAGRGEQRIIRDGLDKKQDMQEDRQTCERVRAASLKLQRRHGREQTGGLKYLGCSAMVHKKLPSSAVVTRTLPLIRQCSGKPEALNCRDQGLLYKKNSKKRKRQKRKGFDNPTLPHTKKT